MTLLEVVLAVALLALVTGAVTSTAGFVVRMETEHEQTLGAYEVANRVILQYLDDKHALESQRGKPFGYGVHRYGWDLVDERVTMRTDERAEAGRRSPVRNMDRFRHLTVTTWPVDGRGVPLRAWGSGEPMARLTRVLDPFASRNPDAQDRFMDNPANLTDLWEEINAMSGEDAAPMPAAPSGAMPTGERGTEGERGSGRSGRGRGEERERGGSSRRERERERDRGNDERGTRGTGRGR